MSLRVAAQKNFVDPANSQDTSDENGHGTAVALVIHDLAPTAEMIIYKVADATGRASEWDTLAALVADTGSHVINISLCFGLGDAQCRYCGRESMSSRSAVFENVIGQLPGRSVAPTVVAAAGNQAKNELSFPARFAEVLAISSVTSHRELSSFSSYGDTDQVGNKHKKHFAAPGGESRGPNQEFIGNYGAGAKGLCGTSFSAAYASGVLANLWGEQGAGTPATAIVDILKRRADTAFPGYDSTRYGNGVIRI
jgi:subtilisin family serine protease